MLKPIFVVATLEVGLVLVVLAACCVAYGAIQRRWRAIWATQRYRVLATAALLIVVVSQLSGHTH